MAARTGVYSLTKTANRMCQLILAYGWVIRKVFPSNNALHAAIDAAAAACAVLRLELEEVREYGD